MRACAQVLSNGTLIVRDHRKRRPFTAAQWGQFVQPMCERRVNPHKPRLGIHADTDHAAVEVAPNAVEHVSVGDRASRIITLRRGAAEEEEGPDGAPATPMHGMQGSPAEEQSARVAMGRGSAMDGSRSPLRSALWPLLKERMAPPGAPSMAC